jgi:hypothetical protein
MEETMKRQDLTATIRIDGHAPALMGAALVVAISILATGVDAAAVSGPTPVEPPAMAFQQQASPGEPIPLSPLTDLTSFDATVVIEADGTVDGEPTQGDLTVELTTNDQAMSRFDITGSLLGDVVAQVGGKAVSLFRPKSVSVYTVPEGTFAVVTGLFDVCVKVDDPEATEILDQLSPQFLLSTLTSSDVARGTFAGDETLDGTPVAHYVIDGEAFVAAAQGSADPQVSSFAQSLLSATDADVYVAADGGYPVAYRGGFGGTFEPLEFDGDLTVQIDVTGVNGNTDVLLPSSCDNPISV